MGNACVPQSFQEIVLTFVGDSGVGKSALVKRYKESGGANTTTSTEQETATNPLDAVFIQLRIDGTEYNVQLVDTYSSFDGDEIRALSYQSSNAVVIIFAVDDRKSFTNVESRWYAEVKSKTKGVPIILCGTKTDCRQGNSADHVTAEEAKQLSKNLEMDSYVECAILENDSYKEVVQQAANEAKKFMSPKQLLHSQSSRLI